MFGGSTEKRVAREVERIVSLKEDLDARSWSRVLEIGRLLERADDETLAEASLRPSPSRTCRCALA